MSVAMSKKKNPEEGVAMVVRNKDLPLQRKMRLKECISVMMDACQRTTSALGKKKDQNVVREKKIRPNRGGAAGDDNLAQVKKIKAGLKVRGREAWFVTQIRVYGMKPLRNFGKEKNQGLGARQGGGGSTAFVIPVKQYAKGLPDGIER